MNGILYGIGVGPGEPELITLKAYNCIKDSDIIILPAKPKEDCYAYRSVYKIYPEIEKKEIVCLPFPMTKDREALTKSHDAIYREISTFLKMGRTAAFLTIGDPSLYSTYSQMHKRAQRDKIEAHMISGVPSFCAAAAAAGIPLGDNQEQIHIIPASYDVKHTMDFKGTRIYMKSGRKLKELKHMLMETEDLSKFQIYSISNCGIKGEKITEGVELIDENSGYLTIVIVKENGIL